MKLPIILVLFLSFITAMATAAENQSSSTAKNIRDIINRIKGKYQLIEQYNSANSPDVLINTLESSSISSNKELPSAAQSVETGIAVGEELILDIMLKRWFLGDLFAYKSASGAQISLSQLFLIIDFPIEIDLSARKASGWFLKESNRFHFDFSMTPTEDAQVTINGITSLISPNDIRIEGNDIYVDGNLVSEWFGLNLNYNFNDLKVVLQPTQMLPIEQRLIREKRKTTSTKKNTSMMPWKESSYQLISSPLVDIQLQSNFNKNNGFYSSYSALGSHDLAYMNTSYYIAGNKQQGLSDARLKFTKQASEATLLPGLPATYFEIGDVNGVNGNSPFSRGFLLANSKTTKSDNNRISLNGDIQPGWDIELYHNNILIKKETSLQTGRYEFNDIDLFYGENDFQIISYGPQGQVVKKHEEFYVNKNLLGLNDSNYAMSITQSGKSLLGINKDRTVENEGWIVSSRYGQGITPWLSLQFGQSYLFNNQGKDIFSYNLGANMTLFNNLLLNSTTKVNQDNGFATQFSAKTVLGKQSLFYKFQQNKDNIDNLDSLSVSESTSHQFKMSGAFAVYNKFKLNYANSVFHKENNLNQATTSAINQLNLRKDNFSLQNDFNWQSVHDGQESIDTFTGFVGFTRRFGPIYTRLSSGYSIKPTAKVENLSSEFSWSMTDTIQSTLKLNYQLEQKSYQAQLSTFWQNEYFNFSSNVNYTDQNEWSFGLSLRLGIGYELKHDKYFFNPTPLTNSGSVIARVFEDLNSNGQFDKGEPLIEGAKVKALQHRRQGITGEDGLAVIKNMPNNTISDIVLDQESLADPFWIPLTPGVAITARRGYLEQLDFPVVTAGEVDGTVYLIDKNGVEKPLSSVEIELINDNGEIVQTTRSEYDGYYLFVNIVPGQYHVVITDSYIKKHKLKESDGLAINLSAQGEIFNGSDLSMEQLIFSSGYVVNVGSFTSLTMLKTYWHLIQRRHRSRLRQTVFYVKNELTNKYQLNLGFYKEKTTADNACDITSKADINCTVEPYEFALK